MCCWMMLGPERGCNLALALPAVHAVCVSTGRCQSVPLPLSAGRVAAGLGLAPFKKYIDHAGSDMRR